LATMTIHTAATSSDELTDMPIDASLIQEGQPVARGAFLTQSEDRKVTSGLWTCEPGRFQWTFDWDEFIHVLEGVVEITTDGMDQAVTLGPGDVASFPRGMKTCWNVKQKVKKFFVIRTREPLSI
jgi:uncharacterized protein